MVVVLSLFAAAFNAASSVLQRRAASGAPDEDALTLKLIGYLIRRPAWILGVFTLLGGFLLQAAALNSGELSTVEPILVVELPLTLLFASLAYHGRLGRREWLAVGAITFGLAGMLYAASPSGGNAAAVSAWHWVLAGIAAGGLIGTLTLGGIRASGDRRAALLGGAAGSGFGVTAALIKAATAQLDQGGAAGLFTTWEVYAGIGCGVGSFFLLQNALQAGRLVAAQPAVTLGDPIVSVLLGVWLFGEKLRTGWLAVPELVGVGLIAAGTVSLAHSRQLAATLGARS